MTLGTLEIKKARKRLGNPGTGMKTVSARGAAPLSGKTLAFRLKGLLNKAEVSRLERNINESCEQIDD